jgi:hypothetical protein
MLDRRLARIWGYLPVAGLCLAVVLGLIWAVANFRTERNLLHFARFACLVEKGELVGERLTLNLQNDSFYWTGSPELSMEVYRVSANPLEVHASSSHRSEFGFSIREVDGEFLLRGGFGIDSWFRGRCHFG